MAIRLKGQKAGKGREGKNCGRLKWGTLAGGDDGDTPGSQTWPARLGESTPRLAGAHKENACTCRLKRIIFIMRRWAEKTLLPPAAACYLTPSGPAVGGWRWMAGEEDQSISKV